MSTVLWFSAIEWIWDVELVVFKVEFGNVYI